ncbi:MAG: CHAT domain-containing protein [Saprospiraceae bacterium]|nr:CHAT domain-containing protein [Lewinella sp.]
MNRKPVIVLCAANQASSPLSYPEQEIEAINQILYPLKRTDVIEIERPYGRSLQDLAYVFLNQKDGISIFHYAGHADSQAIFFPDKAAHSKGLARILGEQENLQLVFLNGCSTSGQVDALFKAGIKAVIGTYAPVGDRKALDFAKAFYNALASGRNLQQAFNFAKGIIEADTSFSGAPAIEFVTNRSLSPRYEEQTELPWNLFVADEHREVLRWRLVEQRKSTWWKYPILILSVIVLGWLIFEGLPPTVRTPGADNDTHQDSIPDIDQESRNQDTVPGVIETEVPDDPVLPPAQLEIIPLSHDFGEMIEGSEASFELNVSNTGGQTLKISSVSSQDEWLRIISYDQAVAPGQSSTVTIQARALAPAIARTGGIRISSNGGNRNVTFDQEVLSRFIDLDDCPLGYEQVKISYVFEGDNYSFTSEAGGKIDLKIPRVWVKSSEERMVRFEKDTITYQEPMDIDGQCIQIPMNLKTTLDK